MQQPRESAGDQLLAAARQLAQALVDAYIQYLKKQEAQQEQLKKEQAKIDEDMGDMLKDQGFAASKENIAKLKAHGEQMKAAEQKLNDLAPKIAEIDKRIGVGAEDVGPITERADLRQEKSSLNDELTGLKEKKEKLGSLEDPAEIKQAMIEEYDKDLSSLTQKKKDLTETPENELSPAQKNELKGLDTKIKGLTEKRDELNKLEPTSDLKAKLGKELDQDIKGVNEKIGKCDEGIKACDDKLSKNMEQRIGGLSQDDKNLLEDYKKTSLELGGLKEGKGLEGLKPDALKQSLSTFKQGSVGDTMQKNGYPVSYKGPGFEQGQGFSEGLKESLGKVKVGGVK